MNMNITISRLILFLMCTIISSMTASALELKQAVDGPSYEDTVKFILKNGVGICRTYDPVTGSIDVVTGRSVIQSIDNCVMIVSNSYYTGNDKNIKNSGYLEGVQKINVGEIEEIGGFSKYPFGKDSPCCEVWEMNGKWFFSGDMRTTDEIKRFSKAIQHLRKLCGAKESPF